ncbi:MAG TPA: hypothetical protein VK747_22950 [Blastocatellia bacterium]|jgi:hypothetical protein|nr:hypothetical protein [Blastocatellia bacterium]
MRKLICACLDDAESFDPTDIVVSETSLEGDRRGEEKLMVAVLEDAIKCFQKYPLGTTIGKKGFSKKWKIGF